MRDVSVGIWLGISVVTSAEKKSVGKPGVTFGMLQDYGWSLGRLACRTNWIEWIGNLTNKKWWKLTSKRGKRDMKLRNDAYNTPGIIGTGWMGIAKKDRDGNQFLIDQKRARHLFFYIRVLGFQHFSAVDRSIFIHFPRYSWTMSTSISIIP